MTSLVDLENPRTDYFSHVTVMTDAVEPSSSPSDDSSPYRTLIDDRPRPNPAPTARSAGAGYHTDDDRGKHSSRAYSGSRESRKMSTLLLLTSERLEKEIKRANEAERKTGETMTLLRTTVEAKMMAEREASRVGEELRLYKLQYENAQKEIYKAQDFASRLEARMLEAEEAAARARSTARKLKEQNLVMLAREEGRQLGYEEGLARGRSMAYDDARRTARLATPIQEDYAVVEEDDDDEEEEEYVAKPLRRSPFAVPIREQESIEPRRPATHDTALHAPKLPVPTLTTPVEPPSPAHAPRGPPPPPPVSILASSTVRNRNRSNSERSFRSVPPDNWIPVADENKYIAMPPPHQMSEASGSPSYMDQSLPAPVPPQPQPDATKVRDYAYTPSGSRPSRRQTMPQPQRPKTPQRSPPSQTSTRISDYGLLTSPAKEETSALPPPPLVAPMPVFREVVTEPNTPGQQERSGWKYDPRSWVKKNPEPRISPPRVNGPRPRPESITTEPPLPIPPPPVTLDPPRRPRAATQSSSSSSTSTSNSSSSSSFERAKNDPRKDYEGGARTPLGWLFKKKYRDRFQEQNGKESGESGHSSVAFDITVQSPSNSSVSHADDQSPTTTTQPGFLSPEYRETPLPQPAGPTPSHLKPRAQEKAKQGPALPPLADLNNLISPGGGNLPLGFVPNPGQPQRTASRASDRHQQPPPARTPSRTASRNQTHRRGVSADEPAEGYATAPLPAGFNYPPSPGFGMGGVPGGKSHSYSGTRSRRGTVSSVDGKA